MPMHLRTHAFKTYMYVVSVSRSHNFKLVLFSTNLTDFDVFGRVLTGFRCTLPHPRLLSVFLRF